MTRRSPITAVKFFSILVEICIVKMQEEIDAWTDKERVCPVVPKQNNAQDALKANTVDKEELDVRYFELAGSFHARQQARMKSQC